MGLKYLNGARWADITREERVFCARLYELIRASGADSFVRYLNQRHGADLDEQAAWEPAYELCFYRDLHHHRRAPGVPSSPKRTFDLALLSDDTIVIIEAKAQGEFHDEQLKSFALDRTQVIEKTSVGRVVLAALSSSLYAVPAQVQAMFDGPKLTWKELAAHFGDDAMLLRADAVYESTAFAAYGRNNEGGHMTGAELMACHQRGEDFWIGRGGGLSGPRLAEDIATGRWTRQRYETNGEANEAPSRNWFRLSELARRLRG
jgi:hypothetical protein